MADPQGGARVSLSAMVSQRDELNRKINAAKISRAIEYLSSIDGLNSRDTKRLAHAHDDLAAILRDMGVDPKPQTETNESSLRPLTQAEPKQKQKLRKSVESANRPRQYKVDAAVLKPLRVFLGRDDLPDTLREFAEQVFGEDWRDVEWQTTRGKVAATVRLEDDIATGAQSYFRKALRAGVTRVYDYKDGLGLPPGYTSSDQIRQLYEVSKKRSLKAADAKLKQWGI